WQRFSMWLSEMDNSVPESTLLERSVGPFGIRISCNAEATTGLLRTSNSGPFRGVQRYQTAPCGLKVARRKCEGCERSKSGAARWRGISLNLAPIVADGAPGTQVQPRFGG